MRGRIAISSAGTALILLTSACSSSGTVSSLTGQSGPTSTVKTPTSPPSDTPSPSDAPTSTFPEADQAAPSSDAPSDAATSATPTSPPPSGPAYTTLQKKIVPYPAGSTPWKVNKTGPLSLDDFVTIFYSEDTQQKAKDLTRQRGFQAAYLHGWFEADGSQAEIFLVKFSAAAGAASMYQDIKSNWSTAKAPDTTFSDTAVHGFGEILPTLDDLGNALVKIAFQSGDTVGYVRVFTPATPNKQAAMKLAQSQYTLLSH